MKNGLSNRLQRGGWIILTVLFLLGGSGFPIQAQKYFTRTYTESDGLSSSMVFDVVQDSNGILWFATRSGISSYDGIQFTNYSLMDGLSQASYAFLKLDKRGNLWAIPDDGTPSIFRFDDSGWTLLASLSQTKVNATFSTFNLTGSDADQIFLIGTFEYGLFCYQNSKWRQYTIQDGLPSNCIRGVYATADTIYIATDRGLILLEKSDGKQKVTHIHGLPSEDLLAIAPEQGINQDFTGSRIWLLGDGWMGFLQGSKFSLCARDFKIRVSDIQSICFIYPDIFGGVYFGNHFYLYYLQPGEQLETLGRKNGLISDGATKVLTDRERNTWITNLRGVTKVPLKRIQGYSQTEGLCDNEVASALEIKPGKYLFGHHGTLTLLENGEFSCIGLDASGNLKSQEMRIQDIGIDPSGNIWLAASSRGLGQMDRNGRIIWYSEEQGLPGMIVTVCVNADGDVFTSNKRNLYRFDPDRDAFCSLPRDRYPNSGIRKLFSGNGNTLVIASFSDGLFERKNNHEMNFKSPDRRQGNNVYAYFQDSKNRKWVGASDGLFLVVDTMLQRFNSNSLSISRPVYLILEDLLGNLWFGTDNGVYCWDGEHLEHLSAENGFFGPEVNRDAGFVDSKGNIWFGTNNGVNIISSESGDPKNEIPPPLVRLTFFKSKDDSLSLNQNHIIPAGQNTLVFHFRAISLVDERKVFYKCMLEGFDKEWSAEIFAHTTHYRYSNLRPGTYRFCLKACNALGTWSEPVCSGTIRIRQPVWLQWWFILAFLAVVLSALYGAGRVLVIQRYNLRLRKMVALRTRALRASEKDLQESNTAKDNFFSIIAHDLKSPFNAILGMLELLTTEYSEFTDQERQKILLNLRNASVRTIDLLDNLLTWAQAQKGLIPFSPLKFDLKELISENIALFEPTALAKRIRLIGPDPEPALVYADRNMISTVIRNLISNAIKFSFPEGNVTIDVHRSGDKKILVSVIDTGTGMNEHNLKNLFILDKRTTAKGTGNETGTGLGLILSRDFASRNRGKLSAESKEGGGSTFRLILPVNPPETHDNL